MKVTLNDEETTTATTKIEKSKEKKMPATKKEKIEVSKVEFGKAGGKNTDILNNDDSEDEEEDEIKNLEKIYLKKQIL